MKFDKSKIITQVTVDQAEVGDIGWVADTWEDMQLQIENIDKCALVSIDPEGAFPFQCRNLRFAQFYPVPEPTYAERQAKWVEENNVKIGDKIKVGRYDGIIKAIRTNCLSIKGNDVIVFDCEYSIIELIRYRPFKSAEECLRHLWFYNNHVEDQKGDTQICAVIGDYSCLITKQNGSEMWSFSYMLENGYTVDGNPFGVKE